jgi:hypothetical protein
MRASGVQLREINVKKGKNFHLQIARLNLHRCEVFCAPASSAESKKPFFQFHVDFKLKIFSRGSRVVASDTFSIKNNDSWIDGDFFARLWFCSPLWLGQRASLHATRESSLNWLSGESFWVGETKPPARGRTQKRGERAVKSARAINNEKVA